MMISGSGLLFWSTLYIYTVMRLRICVKLSNYR